MATCWSALAVPSTCSSRWDRKLEKQHDLSAMPFGVVVIVAQSNRMPDLLPLADALREVVAQIGPGKVEHVGGRGAE
jgi:hypothetical protein